MLGLLFVDVVMFMVPPFFLLSIDLVKNVFTDRAGFHEPPDIVSDLVLVIGRCDFLSQLPHGNDGQDGPLACLEITHDQLAKGFIELLLDFTKLLVKIVYGHRITSFH
jgi:hypothetical protein